jgi:hypothetical protein
MGRWKIFCIAMIIKYPPICPILKNDRKNPAAERVSFPKRLLFMMLKPIPTNVLPDSA